MAHHHMEKSIDKPIKNIPINAHNYQNKYKDQPEQSQSICNLLGYLENAK